MQDLTTISAFSDFNEARVANNLNLLGHFPKAFSLILGNVNNDNQKLFVSTTWLHARFC